MAAGCGAAGGPPAADGDVTIDGTEPQTDLLPANATDPTSADFLEAMYAGLYGYRANGATYPLMADSVTTTDSRNYHIVIKKGWKFHDGTEVKAHNFVDAWNYAADPNNAQRTRPFFEQIAGYDDRKPTLSGLRVTDDYEFDIQLKAPFSVFTSKVGYTPFSPLPDSFFKNPKAFAGNPIGNGPMRFVSHTPGTDIKLTRYDDYQGPNKVQFKNLTIRTYTSVDAAYKDLLAGNLDFMDAIPSSAKAADKYETDLGDQVIKSKLYNISSILVPAYRPEYTLDVRRAISLAINREQLINAILGSTDTPADGWVPDGIEGYEPGVCGEWCKYNPDKAKELFAKSGFQGRITISANTDGTAKLFAEALCNNIKNVLGVDCVFLPSSTFGQYRTLIDDHKLPGLGTIGWGADYPSIEDFLNPVFKSTGSDNDAACSDKQVDALLEQADATPDKDAAIKVYQQAHHLLVNSMCHIPLFFGGGIAAKSKRLKEAAVNFRAHLDLATVRL